MANQKPSSSTSPQIHFKKTHVTSSSSMHSSCGSIASPSNSGKAMRQLSARKGQHTWSIDASFLTDDGFQWRKYGQKILLNEKYQKNYFRCSYKYDQGCQASKQVHRIQEDPPIFRTTYIGHHTCKNPHEVAQQIITTNSSNSVGSFNLVNTLGDPIQGESCIATAKSKISGEKKQCPLTSSYQQEESMEEGSVIGKTYTAASPDSDMGKDLTLCISSNSISSCGSAASTSNLGSSGKDSSETRRQLSARRNQQTRSTDTSFLTDDGFQWRKYGQKVILNEKYPKNYFRCSYKYDEGCQASKQVQRIQEDPPIYRTTYFGHHTCRNPHDVAQQIITTDSSNSMGSFNLVNTRGDPIPSKSCIVSAKSKICGDQNQCPLTSSYQQEEEGLTYNAASPDFDMGKDLTLCISSDSVMYPSSTS